MNEKAKFAVDFVDADYSDFDQRVEEIAEEKGCTVFYPSDNQLTIDIDSDEQYLRFQRRATELNNLTGYKIEISEMPSKSGLPHRHMLLTCSKDFTEVERIALQFCLCSDPVRETMNMWRHICGIQKPTRFFQPKQS